MRLTRTFAIIFFIVALAGRAAGGEIMRVEGTAQGSSFSAVYREGDKSLEIDFRGKPQTVAIDGYAVSDMVTPDFAHTGNEVLAFVDLAGASAGGSVRVFAPSGTGFAEIANDFAASTIEKLRLARRDYLLLLQHDTEDLSFVSDALTLKNGHLMRSSSPAVWRSVVATYRAQAKGAKEPWQRSRFDSYMVLAYLKIGKKTEAEALKREALKLDPENPFAR